VPSPARFHERVISLQQFQECCGCVITLNECSENPECASFENRSRRGTDSVTLLETHSVTERPTVGEERDAAELVGAVTEVPEEELLELQRTHRIFSDRRVRDEVDSASPHRVRVQRPSSWIGCSQATFSSETPRTDGR